MKRIGKLVRDKIPEAVRKSGQFPIIKTLKEDEYLRELDKTFIEEQKEFLDKHNIDELADILEIVNAYCNALGIDYRKLEATRKEKKQNNGGFSKRIYLEGTE